MAGVNAWLVASIAVLPALFFPLWTGLRGPVAHRFVAVGLLSTLASLLLVMLSFAFDQPSFLDVGLTLTLLSLPGTLLIATFVERWL